jgi:putative transposase
MSRPSRRSNPKNAMGHPRRFFVTTKTAGGRSFFQTQRMANLLIQVLRDYMREERFTVHDFVVMPNHVHLLLTIPGDTTIEKAVQLVKGSFSFRAKRELNYQGEIWQRGFSDVRVSDERSFSVHQEHIDSNPVKAGLVSSSEEYPYGSKHLKLLKRAGAEARTLLAPSRHD